MQMQQLKKMGPIGGLLEMIPGMGGAAKEAQQAVDRGDLKRVEAIIQSMTLRGAARPGHPQRHPPAAHRARLGHHVQDVNRLIKQFAEMQKMMKQLSGAGGRRQMLGMGGPRR